MQNEIEIEIEIENENEIKIENKKQDEETSLLGKNPNPSSLSRWCYWIFIRVCVLSYNFGAVANYFVSANGFLKHIVGARDIPSFFADHKDEFDHNITDLNAKDWQIPLLVIYIYFSMVLFVTHELTIPKRLYHLYGKHESENQSLKRTSSKDIELEEKGNYDEGQQVSAEDSNKNSSGFIKNMTFVLSMKSAFWKTFVQGTSLLALLAMIPLFEGAFWLVLGLSILFSLGTFMAQASNFIKQIQEDWGWCASQSQSQSQSQSSSPFRKAFAVFCTSGYVLTNVGLYFNTINQGPERNGWLSEPLTQLPQKGLLGFFLAIQILFVSFFGVQTGKYYFDHIDAVLGGTASPPSSPASGVAEAMNVGQLLSDKRVTYGGIFAAGYKTFSNFLSLAFFARLLMDVAPATVGYVFLGLLAVSQVFNFYAQLAFYSYDKPEANDCNTQDQCSTFRKLCW